MSDDPDKHCSKHPDGPKIRARRVGTLEGSCLLCGEHLCDAGPVRAYAEARDIQTLDSVGDVESVLGFPDPMEPE